MMYNTRFLYPTVLALLLCFACSKENSTDMPDGTEDQIVAVTGITIGQSDLLLKVEESMALSAIVEPANATNKSITWESSDQSIVSIDSEGKITGINKGSTTIRVISGENAKIKDEIVVEVYEEQGQEAFITTWNTELITGFSPTVIIPTAAGETYDYTIDWGDGNTEENVTGDATHHYENHGIYQIIITGQFPRIYFNYENSTLSRRMIASVDQWGSNEWTSMERAFAGCVNLEILATDLPNLSKVSNMSEMFALCQKLEGNPSMRSWDVSTINDMGALFAQCDVFNLDISSWNVHKVEDMSGMFLGCDIFDQNIGGWDVSAVKDMGSMFGETLAFNQDIGNWDTSNVIVMEWMFASGEKFNQDISGWDVSKVTDMSYMFISATSFDQNLGSWNVSEVTDMEHMFNGSKLSTANYDALLEGWNNLPYLQPSVQFNAGNTQYCNSESARQAILSNFNWSIADGGLHCN